MPTISADDSCNQNIQLSAELIASLFTEIGQPRVEILSVPGGKPAVVARYPAPGGQPTILLYAHHDVQPVGDPDDWTNPAFEPIERDGRLFGRGTADDKAGVVAHLAALRAHDGQPPIGVTVFIEGEEEIGSPHLRQFLIRYQDKLSADIILLADSQNYDLHIPSLTTSLRGTTSCIVEVRTLDQDVHSGTYGGPTPDALTALCRLLATLHDEDGNTAIKGLLTANAGALDYSEERFRSESGVVPGVHLLGSGPIADRLWRKPAVSVLGIDACPVDETSNVLKAHARAKVGLRVAPGDDAIRARQALARHLVANAPWGVEVTVTEGSASQPHAIEPTGAAFDAARIALRGAYGEDAVEIGAGGRDLGNQRRRGPQLASSRAKRKRRTHGPRKCLPI
jgi:cysteinylglycine-S-conjugate dipeptidase